MEHKIYYQSGHEAFRIDRTDAFSYEDTSQILPILKNGIASGHTSTVADVSKSPRLSSDWKMRRLPQEKGLDITFDKMAFVGHRL